MTHQFIHRFLGSLVFLTALVLYGLTVSPTVSFWDCGEFIATSFTMGIPHPPGTPIYMLLGRFFTSIPFVEDIGLRMNYISVISSAVSILLTYLIIIQLIKYWKPNPNAWDFTDKISSYGGAVVGAFVLMTSESFWFNSVESEVYAISLTFTALVVWITFIWAEHADEPHSDRYLLLIAYLMGLATGIHLLNLLTIFMVTTVYYFRKYEFSWFSFFTLIGISVLIFLSIYPGLIKGIPVLFKSGYLALLGFVGLIVFAIYWTHKNRLRFANLASLSVFMIVIGYASYAVIFIRANTNPPINENDPSTPAAMYSYLNREQYGDSPFFNRRWSPDPIHQQSYAKYKSDGDYFWSYQINHMFNRYLAWNFIGKSNDEQDAGWDPSKFWFLPFILGFIGLYHHVSKDYKNGLAIIALFFVTGYAIVLYLNQTEPQPRERDYSYVGAFFVFALWVGIGASAILDYFKTVISKNEYFKYASPAILFLMIVFIPGRMLAINYSLNDRSKWYVPYDYARNILASLEPNAIIFTNGDNDTFPLWYQQEVEGFRTDVRVANLSLLNTDWYIKQLKNDEPRGALKVPMPSNLTDQMLKTIQAIPWAKEGRVVYVPVNKTAVMESELGSQFANEFNVDDTIVWKMDPAMEFRGIPLVRVQDFMIYNIISSSQWKRPIYFTVTVPEYNRIGLDNYLQLEGLVYRLVPKKGGDPFQRIQPEKMKENLLEKYWYRNMHLDGVFYDENIRKLGLNYRNLFQRLAFHFLNNNDHKTAIEVMDKMQELISNDSFPIDDPRIYVNISEVYKDQPDNRVKYFEILAQAEELLQIRIEKGRFDPMNYILLERVYVETNRLELAANTIEELLKRYPNDPELRRRADGYKKQLLQK